VEQGPLDALRADAAVGEGVDPWDTGFVDLAGSQRVTWERRDHRGRKLDPEWANRRRLLRARERLSQSSFARMWNTIVDEDPSAQILSVWIAKEELNTLLSTVRTGGDPHPPSTPGGPKSTPTSHTGITNARTEGYNRLVKQVKRVGCGFKLARSKSKTTCEARRGGTERGVGES
jgi:transposase